MYIVHIFYLQFICNIIKTLNPRNNVYAAWHCDCKALQFSLKVILWESENTKFSLLLYTVRKSSTGEKSLRYASTQQRIQYKHLITLLIWSLCSIFDNKNDATCPSIFNVWTKWPHCIEFGMNTTVTWVYIFHLWSFNSVQNPSNANFCSMKTCNSMYSHESWYH
jgi:hypothetical protein